EIIRSRWQRPNCGRNVAAVAHLVGGDGRRILRLKSVSPAQPPQGPTPQSNTNVQPSAARRVRPEGRDTHLGMWGVFVTNDLGRPARLTTGECLSSGELPT